MASVHLLIAIAATASAQLATAQPEPRQFAEIPAWLKELEGSCFQGADRRGAEMRKCFGTRDGKFTISSSDRSAGAHHRSECVIHPVAFSPQRFELKCLEDGVRPSRLVGSYEGEGLHLEGLWLRRNAPPANWPRETWQRRDSHHLEIVSNLASDLFWGMPARSSTTRRLVLTRVSAAD